VPIQSKLVNVMLSGVDECLNQPHTKGMKLWLRWKRTGLRAKGHQLDSWFWFHPYDFNKENIKLFFGACRTLANTATQSFSHTVFDSLVQFLRTSASYIMHLVGYGRTQATTRGVGVSRFHSRTFQSYDQSMINNEA